MEGLLRMLSAGTSAALTVEAVAGQLSEAGFQELQFAEEWGLARGGRYYMKHHQTALFAFAVGSRMQGRDGMRLATAHTDYPCLRIKANPDVEAAGYGQLNVEVYGSPILNTWMDRPLGISGRVALKSQEAFRPQMRLIDSRRPVAVIPNLAIHLNREADRGKEANRQKELLPIIFTGGGEEGQEGFLDFLASELEVRREEILDYELWLCCLQEPQFVGIRQEFLTSPRLDNLTSVQALTSSLAGGQRQQGINLIALFDHEEVGSRGKQGAHSALLGILAEKIYQSLGLTGGQAREAIYRSMMLSADVAQGCHPNYLERMDPTNRAVLNGGICIKEASVQSYATDCEAIAIVEQLCQAHGIAYQKYLNHSDQKGGGTIGIYASSVLPIPTVDIGVPILAMHSAAETMGRKDQAGLERLMAAFFQDEA